jgi:hypothetical protein
VGLLPVRDIPDRVDVRHVGLRKAINGNAAVLRIDGDAGPFESEICNARMPADRKQHLIGGDARPVRQMRCEFVTVPINLVDSASRKNGDALFFHLRTDVRANIVVETAQDIVAAIDHRHIAAKSCKDAGELERDVSAALDRNSLRQFPEMKYLVGGDHVLDAGNDPPVVGGAARCDQHVFRTDGFACRQPQRMRVLEYRPRLDDARTRLLDIGCIGCL